MNDGILIDEWGDGGVIDDVDGGGMHLLFVLLTS